jgi:hypothetical protein
MEGEVRIIRGRAPKYVDVGLLRTTDKQQARSPGSLTRRSKGVIDWQLPMTGGFRRRYAFLRLHGLISIEEGSRRRHVSRKYGHVPTTGVGCQK